jgi:hypothetical protein
MTETPPERTVIIESDGAIAPLPYTKVIKNGN